MKHSESEKPEYVYRPTIYFHAADDTEAKSRCAALRYSIEKTLENDDTDVPKYTYPDVEHRADSLGQRERADRPERIVT